jgi:50S ribosomal subunit-associated GTPase HflX
VLNKVDLLPAAEADTDVVKRRILADATVQLDARAVTVSAQNASGLDRLLTLIDDTLPLDPVTHARFRFPASEGSQLHMLHEYGRVLTTNYTDEYCEVEAEVPESIRARLSAYLI